MKDDQAVVVTGVFPALCDQIRKDRRIKKLKDRRTNFYLTGVFAAFFGADAAMVMNHADLLPVLSCGVLALLMMPYAVMFGWSFTKDRDDFGEYLNPDALGTSAPMLASDLRRLAQILLVQNEEHTAEFVSLSGSVAARLAAITETDFRTDLPRDLSLSEITPAKRARETAKGFESLAVIVEGRLEDPATIRGFANRTGRTVQWWRRCAEDLGVFIPEIVHEDDVPLRSQIPAIQIGSTDILDVVAARLPSDAVVIQLKSLRQRIRDADPRFFSEMDGTETANMLDHHLPRLSSRFITAYDASSGMHREEVCSVTTASMAMLASALEGALARHAAAARSLLQTEHRFLEAKIIDPWKLEDAPNS